MKNIQASNEALAHEMPETKLSNLRRLGILHTCFARLPAAGIVIAIVAFALVRPVRASAAIRPTHGHRERAASGSAATSSPASSVITVEIGGATTTLETTPAPAEPVSAASGASAIPSGQQADAVLAQPASSSGSRDPLGFLFASRYLSNVDSAASALASVSEESGSYLASAGAAARGWLSASVDSLDGIVKSALTIFSGSGSATSTASTSTASTTTASSSATTGAGIETNGIDAAALPYYPYAVGAVSSAAAAAAPVYGSAPSRSVVVRVVSAPEDVSQDSALLDSLAARISSVEDRLAVASSRAELQTNSFALNVGDSLGQTAQQVSENLDASKVIAGTLAIGHGGTGTSTSPGYGELLIGNANGGYDLVATSTLGVSLADTSGMLPISKGGTNATSETPYGITFFDGTKITSGDSLIFDGSNLTIGTASTSAGLAVNGSVSVAGGLMALYATTTDATSTNLYASSFEAERATSTDLYATSLNAAAATTSSLYASDLAAGNATTSSLYTSDLAAAAATVGSFSATSSSASNYIAGNLGIGTTDPGNSLDISNTNNSQLRLGESSVNAAYTYDIGRNTGTGLLNFYGNQSGYNGYVFGGVDRTMMTILNTGNVGIGTTTPSSPLTIVSNTAQLRLGAASGPGSYFTTLGSLYDSTHPFSLSVADNSQTATEYMGIYADGGGANIRTVFPNGKVGIGTTNPSDKLVVAGGALDVNNGDGVNITRFNYNNGSTNYIRGTTYFDQAPTYFTGGNVGIGTTTPGSQLSVVDPSSYSDNSLLTLDSGIAWGGNMGHISMSTGGVEVARQTWEMLDGNLESSSYNLQTKASNGGMTSRLFIDGSGNIGLGTTTPAANLDSAGSNADFGSGVTDTHLVLRGYNGSYSSIVNNSGSSSNYNGLVITSNADGAGSLPSWAVDIGGADNITYKDGDSFTIRRGGSEEFRISSNGNVGIGTTDSSTTLTLSAANNVPPILTLNTNNTATANGAIKWTNNAGTVQSAIGDNFNQGDASGDLEFMTGGTANTDMVIRSSGNVGIGTTSPAGKLDVETGTLMTVLNPAVNSAWFLNGIDPSLGAGQTRAIVFGKADSADNAGTITYNHAGDGSTSNFLGLGTYGKDNTLAVTAAGNVGIGTSSPMGMLSVRNTSGTPFIYLDNGLGGGTSYSISPFVSGISNSGFQIKDETNNVQRFVISTNGNVGIGTTTPSNKLDVNGGLSITGAGVTANGMRALELQFDTTNNVGLINAINRGVANYNIGLATAGGNVGIGTTSPPDRLSLNGNEYVNGSVGIGTPSPYYELHIASYEPRIGLQSSLSGTTWIIDSTKAGLNSALKFENGTVTPLTMLANGNVGIGTVNPSYGLTDFNDNGSGYAATFATNSTADQVGIGTFAAVGGIQGLTSGGAAANLVLQNAGGNVGIGTTSPLSTLTVTGSGCFSGGVGSTVDCGTAAGNIYYRTANTGNYDVAENYVATDPSISAGDVVAIDPTGPDSASIMKASKGAHAIGIVSTDPGLVLGGSDVAAVSSLSTRPVALSGRVPVKVSTENGSIATGDYLTISSVPGVAMKATQPGTVIGQALAPYDGAGVGKVLAFVKNTFYAGNLASDVAAQASTTEDLATEVAQALAAAQSAASSTQALSTKVSGLESYFSNGALVIDSIGSAGMPISVLGDPTFFGRPYFTSDTAGSAIVKSGMRSVRVAFDRPYVTTPIVSATIALETASSSDAVEGALFSTDVRYIVADKDTTGFTILLNQAAPEDVPFSWIALAVKNAKTFTSVGTPTVQTTTATQTAQTQTTTTSTTNTASAVNTVTSPTTVIQPTSSTSTTTTTTSTSTSTTSIASTTTSTGTAATTTTGMTSTSTTTTATSTSPTSGTATAATPTTSGTTSAATTTTSISGTTSSTGSTSTATTTTASATPTTSTSSTSSTSTATSTSTSPTSTSSTTSGTTSTSSTSSGTTSTSSTSSGTTSTTDPTTSTTAAAPAVTTASSTTP